MPRVALAPAVLGALSDMPRTGSSVPGWNLRSGSPRAGFSVWRGAGADRTFSGELLPRLARVALGACDGGRIAFRSGDVVPDRLCGTSEHRTGVKVPEPRGGCCRTLWVWAGAWRALGADPPREAELRGDLACRRLGSERKDVKRIHARDTGKAGRQFAREVDSAAATDLRQGSLGNRDAR